MKNPRNFFLIYFHVLFNYLIYLVVFTCVMTIIFGFMSKWSINLASDVIAGMSRNPQKAFGELSILTISAFFSALEVKSLGLGWICYFGLLISRVYYLFRPPSDPTFPLGMIMLETKWAIPNYPIDRLFCIN